MKDTLTDAIPMWMLLMASFGFIIGWALGEEVSRRRCAEEKVEDLDHQLLTSVIPSSGQSGYGNITSKRGRRHELRSCARKLGYPALTIAQIAAEKARIRTGQLIVAYPCDYCGKFHIGHLPKKIEQKIVSERSQ